MNRGTEQQQQLPATAAAHSSHTDACRVSASLPAFPRVGVLDRLSAMAADKGADNGETMAQNTQKKHKSEEPEWRPRVQPRS